MGEKMLVIVGAGASRDFGLPMGAQLKDLIAATSSIDYKYGVYRPADQFTSDIAYCCAQKIEPRLQFNAYLAAFNEISEALPLAISIDNYLDVRNSDSAIVTCGKAAIIRHIVVAERESKLYVAQGQKLNFENLKDTWLVEFFKVITEHCRLESIAERLAGISFVIFNYDRCVEQFLFHALQTYYRIDNDRAAEILSGVKFLHPYGTLGNLPWQEGNRPLHFGEEVSADRVVSLIPGILTFTESNGVPESDLNDIRESIRKTEMVLFLGFAYHRLNMRLLFDGVRVDRNDSKQVFGTAFGVSDSDIAHILTEVRNIFRGSPELPTDLTCNRLFSRYSRAISLGAA